MFRLLKNNEVLKRPDLWLYILIMLVWSPSIGRIFNAVVLRIPVISIIGPEMQHIATFVSAVFAFKFLKPYIRRTDIFFYYSCLIYYLLNYIIYPQNTIELDTYLVKVLILSLPAYFVGLAWDINKLDKFLYYVSVFTIFYIAFNFLFLAQERGGFEDNEYHMDAAYGLLPHVIFVAWHLFRQFSLVKLMIFVLGAFMLISFGTRGPIVCLSMFIFLFVFFATGFKHKVFVLVLITVCISFVVFFIEPILIFFSDLLSDLGMSDRIIKQAMLGDFLDDSGRGHLLNILVDAINQAPLHGYGLFGTWRFIGVYSHRIYVDFVISFGLLGGSLLLLYIIHLLYKTFCFCNKTERGFIIVLLCSSIVKLMLSELFLFDTLFFLLLGYCVGRIRFYSFKRIK